MKATAPFPLGPWVKGIQNVNDPAMTPKGCLLEADNVMIDSDGSVHPRAGYALVTTGVSSLFSHGGKVYGLYNGLVCELFDSGARTLSNELIEGTVTWGVLNDEPVLTNRTILAKISGGRVKRIGVEAPTVGGSGGASDRMYAVSFVNEDGEEGPLSPVFSGGTAAAPQEASVVKMRVYATSDDGDMLYFVSDTTPGGTVAGGTVDSIGKPADTMNTARMPGGDFVRYWRGRLLVARGRKLYISDPLRYGLYNQSKGVVFFEARIDFIEPVEGGVFVALRGRGVYFLAGDSPDKWELRVADVIPAQAGASTVIPTAQMKLEVQSKPEWVAVWLTHKGFAIGLPSGNVLYPQADLLSGLPLGTGSLHFEGDRLIALSQ